MATPTNDEIKEIYAEETEAQTAWDATEDVLLGIN